MNATSCSILGVDMCSLDGTEQVYLWWAWLIVTRSSEVEVIHAEVLLLTNCIYVLSIWFYSWSICKISFLQLCLSLLLLLCILAIWYWCFWTFLIPFSTSYTRCKPQLQHQSSWPGPIAGLRGPEPSRPLIFKYNWRQRKIHLKFQKCYMQVHKM